ncbi:MAG: dTDP-4-dehydrorhamnose reductase [Steroidobacteraceae bacterium]
MKVLVTGAGGQLGRELLRRAPATASVRGVERSELDIADAAAVNELIGEFAPDVVINCAAYTAVDRAEHERADAWRVNAEGPRILAAALVRTPARLIHVSTDYVFDGRSARAYQPGDATAPLGEYGRSKLEGERLALGLLGEQALVVRTAWVYGAHGRNFLHTMLRLMRERGSVRVVADQIGTPTATPALAEVLWAAARRGTHGVHHWTDAGVASWYDFAVAIAEEATPLGLLSDRVEITPIQTEDYPTPAARPAFSLLDKRSAIAAFGLQPQHWRQRLREVLGDMVHG